jgi:hypothetical protein
MSELVPFAANVPALVRAAGDRAQTRFWEFFVSNIRNPHTRRAYGRSIAEFLAWCDQHGLASIIDVEPLHVGTYIEAVTRSHSAPTAKQKTRRDPHAVRLARDRPDHAGQSGGRRARAAPCWNSPARSM